MAGLVQFTLERDGHDQPWGFRLQGGSDVGLPLSVQRVLVGTPAEGILRKNDVIIRISQTDAKGLTHQQAADIFNRAGNQIAVTIKRAGVQTSPAAATAHTGAIVANGPHARQQSPPVSGGVALPGFSIVTSAPKVSENPAVASLPQTLFVLKSELPKVDMEPSTNLEAISIQNQPYRTVPLIQPSVKPHPDLGIGSLQHLKMQEDHITGVKEPQLVPVPQAQVKASEILMKQKVTGTLQQIQNQQNMNSGHSSPVGMGSPKPGPIIEPILVPAPLNNADVLPPGVVNKQFNSPINIYSSENVQEAVRQQVTHTSLVNPNPKFAAAAPVDSSQAASTGVSQFAAKKSPQTKPQKVILTPSKEYNPQGSATWRALQESSDPVDPEKVRNYSSLREHDPVYSEIYTAPKLLQFNSKTPVPQVHLSTTNRNPNVRPSSQQANPHGTMPSMVDANPFIPPGRHQGNPHQHQDQQQRYQQSQQQQQQSAVLSATLEEDTRPPYLQGNRSPDKIPLYETEPFEEGHCFRVPGRKTNSIGGRRRIAQSQTFNKVMMEVLGE